MTFEAVGWCGQRQLAFAPHAALGQVPGRVVGEHRTHFQVATEAGEIAAELTGRLRNGAKERSDLPGVGDFVAVRLAQGDGPATIEEVLPRTSALVRKAAGEVRPQLLAANIDSVFIVTAVGGDFNLPRLERYLALVRESGANPVIVVNKIDLARDVSETADQFAELVSRVPVHAISARASDGIRDLEAYFDGNKTVALIGSSGVGKSTLTNQLLGRAAQATQDVRAHDGRGRHTTTHRQLFIRPRGGTIIDTPGLRGLELWNAPEEVESRFDDIELLATHCKFRNCRHGSEPGCAVRASVERGELDAARALSYATQERASSRSAR